jgi:hypothetical protein
MSTANLPSKVTGSAFYDPGIFFISSGIMLAGTGVRKCVTAFNNRIFKQGKHHAMLSFKFLTCLDMQVIV